MPVEEAITLDDRLYTRSTKFHSKFQYTATASAEAKLNTHVVDRYRAHADIALYCTSLNTGLYGAV